MCETTVFNTLDMRGQKSVIPEKWETNTVSPMGPGERFQVTQHEAQNPGTAQ